MLWCRLAEHPRHHLLGGGGPSRGIDYISHPVGTGLPRDGRGIGRRFASRLGPLRRADPAGGLRRRPAGHGASAGLSLLKDPGLSRLQGLSRVETLLEAGVALHPVHRGRLPGDPPGGCRPAIRPHDERRPGLSLRRPGLRQYPSHPRLKPHCDGDGRAAPPAGGQSGRRHLWPADGRRERQQRQPTGRRQGAVQPRRSLLRDRELLRDDGDPHHRGTNLQSRPAEGRGGDGQPPFRRAVAPHRRLERIRANCRQKHPDL